VLKAGYKKSHPVLGGFDFWFYLDFLLSICYSYHPNFKLVLSKIHVKHPKNDDDIQIDVQHWQEITSIK